MFDGITKTKIKLDDLVEKKIVLADKKGWVEVGTIWTDNKIDYGFIFQAYPESIGNITVKNEYLEHVKDNVFYITVPSGVFLYNKNSKTIGSDLYTPASRALNKAMKK